jgi:inosine-uridine nucleoside N-ribohydrolase
MLAVKSNMFKIKAITTVAGNSKIENTTRNARFVLKLLGREDIPVYSGSVKPLKRDLIQAVVHGKNGFDGLNPRNRPRLTYNAVDKIISIIKDNPNKITLITLAPLTNIAKAILKSPKNMLKLKEIVIMGGAIRVSGNENRVAEFNMFVDPEAADIVLKFPVKKTLVPLDASNHVKMNLSDFKKIKNSSLREPILFIMRPYIKNIFKESGINAALMYDPLTVYSVMNPDACKKRKYNVIVEVRGEVTRGMTVAELRKLKTEKPNITVVEKISERKFKEEFIKYLSNNRP